MNKRGRLFLFVIVLLPLFSLTVFAAQQAACKFPVAVVSTPEEEAWALRVQDALADNDVTLRIERAPDFGDVEKTLPTINLPAIEAQSLPAEKSFFPVTIPPGAARFGFTHLEELRRFSDAGKFKQAQKYLAKHRDELLDEDALKIGTNLDESIRQQEQFAADAMEWLRTEEGQKFLATDEGTAWYDAHKKPFWGRWLSDEDIAPETISPADMQMLSGKIRKELESAKLETMKGVEQSELEQRVTANGITTIEDEIDLRLNEKISTAKDKRELEADLHELKTLESVALKLSNQQDETYRRIRFKRIALDSRSVDPPINPYTPITEKDREVARAFLPTHKTGSVKALTDIMQDGGLLSIKRRIAKGEKLRIPDERIPLEQEDTIFLSAGIPYSHIQSDIGSSVRHNIPLIVFDKNKVYTNPTFRVTLRDSMIYETASELEKHVLDSKETNRVLELFVANDLVIPETTTFVREQSDTFKVGTFFPEIMIESEIALSDVSKIILKANDKEKLLSDLAQSQKFENLAGRKFESNSNVEKFLKDQFGIELVTPEPGYNVDQMYWKLINLPVPEYS